MYFKMPSKTRYHSKHRNCIPQKVKPAKPKAATSSRPSGAFSGAQAAVCKSSIFSHWPSRDSFPANISCLHLNAELPCRAEHVCCSNICIIRLTSESLAPSRLISGLALSDLEGSRESWKGGRSFLLAVKREREREHSEIWSLTCVWLNLKTQQSTSEQNLKLGFVFV